jgi:hypothetical protein
LGTWRKGDRQKGQKQTGETDVRSHGLIVKRSLVEHRNMELIKQKAYRKSFDVACSRLSELPIEDRLTKAGLRFSKNGEAYKVLVPFCDESMELVLPDCTFKSLKGTNVTLVMKIVTLHYIIEASGNRVGTEMIQYEDIPGCRAYLPVFERRVTKPLVSAFGFQRDAFAAAGKGLGGREEEYGNASFTLYAFPRVPITFILWEGNEEFSPSLKVLFDRSIHTYLPLEDIVVVSKMAATRLIQQARKSLFQ